jgi:hypothetical protein
MPCPYFGAIVDPYHFNADPDPQLWYILWIQVFPRRTLAEILMKMMTSLPAGQLTEQKLDTLRWAPFTHLFSFSSPLLQIGIIFVPL